MSFTKTTFPFNHIIATKEFDSRIFDFETEIATTFAPLNLDHLIKSQENYSTHPRTKREINFPEFDEKHKDAIQEGDKILRDRPLSFLVSDQDLVRFANQAMNIISKPNAIANYLKDLDLELEARLKAELDIEFSDEDPYEFLIEGTGNFIPGPWREDYQPYRKNKLLDKILLEREQKRDLNKNGIATFIGEVSSQDAEFYMLGFNKNIFKEDIKTGTPLIHGKQSHRIMLEALMQAIEKDDLKLEVEDRQTKEKRNINASELLEILLLVNVKREKSRDVKLWNILFDSIGCSIEAADSVPENIYHPEYYSYNSQSPYVFNSLILCFGKELGLKTLQHYLCDSHYKAAFQLMQNIKDKFPETNFNDKFLYSYCMMQLIQGRLKEHPIPILSTVFEFAPDDQLDRYDLEKGFINIGKKNSPSPSMENSKETKRENWDEYDRRKKDEKKRNKPIRTQ